MKAKRRKAIALMSGGLDSQLAAKIVKDQGIETVGLHLLSPFGCRTEIESAAESIGVPLIVREKGASFLELIKNPRYGYGRNMNPCIDCRILMFHIAGRVMREVGADFVVTGEVLGQRPMSQQGEAMELIDQKSGLSGLILRPLSARELPPTVPENEGWIGRENLLAITGRGRKQQLELANKWHLKGYGSPGGGCLLTERMFTPKLKDFFQHEESHLTPEIRLAQSELLRIGRHFRLSNSTKVIVARNEKENTELSERWKKAEGVFFSPDNFDGPNAIAVGPVDHVERQLVGEMIARYGKAKDLLEKRIKFDSTAGGGEFTVVQPVAEETLHAMRI